MPTELEQLQGIFGIMGLPLDTYRVNPSLAPGIPEKAAIGIQDRGRRYYFNEGGEYVGRTDFGSSFVERGAQSVSASESS